MQRRKKNEPLSAPWNVPIGSEAASDKPTRNFNIYQRVFKNPLGIFFTLSVLTAIIVIAIWRVGSAKISETTFQTVTVRKIEAVQDIRVRALAVPFNTVFVDARLSGVVEGVFARNGEEVEANEVLLVLSNRDLANRARSEAIRILERKAALEADVTEANAQVDDQKRQKIAAEAEYDKLAERLDTLRGSLAIGAISRAEVTRQEADVIAQEIEVGRLRASVNRARSNALRTASVNENLSRLLDEEANDREAALRGLTVVSPVSGLLTSLDIRLGEAVDAGQRLGQIDSLDDFKLKAKLDEFYQSSIFIGQSAVMTDVNGRKWPLSISSVEPEIEAGQFGVELTFDTAPGELRRGQSFDISIKSGLPVDKVAIPERHDEWLKDQLYHFVYDEDDRMLQRRTIKIGRRYGDWMEIDDGVSAGEKLVVFSEKTIPSRERISVR